MSEISSALKRAINQAINTDGGLAVFRHYGFEPSRRPQKVNPFRQERTSSFFVIEKSGKVFFKDFGDDTYKGDCKKFIQFYENLDNEAVWAILAQIYGLGNFGISDFGLKKAKTQVSKKIDSATVSKKLLEIKFKDFSQEELDFWWKKGFIDLKTLENNQVKSVLSFKIQNEKGKIQEFANLSFVFAYEIVADEAYKLYMPKPAYRVYAKAKTVFLPNLNSARAKLGEDYAYSFGINTLDLQKPIILCGGEPDCLALKSAGFNAFTLGDERSNIPDFIIKSLSASPSTKVELSILYDTDYTGLKNAYLLAKKLDFQRFILPKLDKQSSRQADKPIYNDLCDYLNLYGWDADLLLVLKRQVFHYQDFNIKNTPCFTVKKYLSEKSDLLVKFSQQYRRIQVDADAGVGKTYSMLVEIAAKFQKPMLFVVPFAIQVEQIEQEYRDLVKDLVCFSNSSMQVGEDEQLNLLGRPIGQINVCTFDRIKPVYERLKQDFKDDIVVVVDESHLLTSEYAYRTRAIHDVLAVCRQAERVIYLSATPDYALCQFSNFRLIRFKREENPQINIQPIDYVGEPKKALLKLLLDLNSNLCTRSSPLNRRGVGAEVSGITVIRLNNKTLARVIARILIEQKIYQAEEIDFVFSEKRRGISTKSKDSIVNHSLIPKNVKLLFVTACFDCGINIQNTDIQQIISFETRYTDNCLDTFKQFIARFRNLQKVQITVCKPERLQHLPPLKSRLQLYERLQKTAENKLALLTYNDLGFQNRLSQQLSEMQNFGLAGPKTPRYIKTNQDISATFKLIVQNTERTAYQVNYNYIRFIVKDYERKYLDSKNFYNNLIIGLENTFVEERQTLFTDTRESNNLILSDLVQKEKENRQNRVQQICELMQKNAQEFFDSVHAEYRDVSLKEQIKRQFSVSAVKDAPKLEQILSLSSAPSEIGGESILSGEPEDALGVGGRLYDEEITELSHRYFFLHDLLIPKAKIPELLKNNADDVNFGILSKTFINHINLYAKRKTGQECNLLITDYRKLEDVNWLELLVQEVQNWQPKIYKQKKTRQLELQLQNLEYDLKLLKYEKRNLNFVAFDYLLKIQQGGKLKAKLRLVKRKLKSLQNQINRLLIDIQVVTKKYENSIIKGFEINELSEKMNKLRTHQADWQGVTANIRLLSSLFHLKTHKRLIYTLDANKQDQYTEKYIIEIGGNRSFREVLQSFSFNEIEIQNYLDYLNYQIELDLEANRQIWSKKLHIPITSAKVDSTTVPVGEKGSKIDQISPADLGYPSFWDN